MLANVLHIIGSVFLQLIVYCVVHTRTAGRTLNASFPVTSFELHESRFAGSSFCPRATETVKYFYRLKIRWKVTRLNVQNNALKIPGNKSVVFLHSPVQPNLMNVVFPPATRMQASGPRCSVVQTRRTIWKLCGI